MPNTHRAPGPPGTGPTQIMDNGEQLYLSWELIRMLEAFGVIEYSPEDGPRANVYRPVGLWSLDSIKHRALARGAR